MKFLHTHKGVCQNFPRHILSHTCSFTPQPSIIASYSHLFVWQARHLVDVLLLDHEGSQVGSVGGQEDDSEEGPHWHHDLAGGTFRILHRDGVVENQTPEQPDGLADGEGGTARLWEWHIRRWSRKRWTETDARRKSTSLYLYLLMISIMQGTWWTAATKTFVSDHRMLSLVHVRHPSRRCDNLLLQTTSAPPTSTALWQGSRMETLPTVTMWHQRQGERERRGGHGGHTAGYNYATAGAVVWDDILT